MEPDFEDSARLPFSYSDTQLYRVGPNYLQLPINAPLQRPATNQRDGQMVHHVDDTGVNPHVNYEPNSLGGLTEADPAGEPHQPYVEGRLGRMRISRTNDYRQAGERYRSIDEAERDDLILNLVDALSQCDRPIQERMVEHLTRCDSDYGRRVAEGIGVAVRDPVAAG